MLRRIKKEMVQNPIVLAAPMRTTLAERPVTQTILSPQGFSLDTVQKAAIVLLLVPTIIGFAASLLSAAWTLFLITGFILMMIGAILWLIRLRSQMVWNATWYDDTVEVEDGRYGQTTHWSEPLSAFTGIELDFGLIQQGNQYAAGRKVHGLLLRHPDPFKSILLHAQAQPIDASTIAWYEAQLGQKLIES
ncbi:MAG: hypothetical protein ACOC9E_04780 [Chloroflexota bacterium]